jgi:hypothetical protein
MQTNKRYEQNMSGWRAALNDLGLESAPTYVSEDRLTTLERLTQSSLPTYQIHKLTPQEFTTTNEPNKIYHSLDNLVVCRIIPKNNQNQRITLIGKTLDEAIRESKRINPTNSCNYTIVLNEYDPASYCGVVISKKDNLTIEIVQEPNLENLCHGKVIPYSAQFTCQFPNQINRMHFLNKVPIEAREKLWQVVKSLSTITNQDEQQLPQYEPMQGYFEFVFSQKDDSLKFIDYRPAAKT